jgi:hypothetical protein
VSGDRPGPPGPGLDAVVVVVAAVALLCILCRLFGWATGDQGIPQDPPRPGPVQVTAP